MEKKTSLSLTAEFAILSNRMSPSINCNILTASEKFRETPYEFKRTIYDPPAALSPVYFYEFLQKLMLYDPQLLFSDVA